MTSSNFSTKLRQWAKNNQDNIEIIGLDKIDIYYGIHKKTGIIHFNGEIEGLVKGDGVKDDQIIVERSDNGRYRLLFNIRDLIMLKLLNVKEHGVIVTDYNRDELEGIIKSMD